MRKNTVMVALKNKPVGADNYIISFCILLLCPRCLPAGALFSKVKNPITVSDGAFCRGQDIDPYVQYR